MVRPFVSKNKKTMNPLGIVVCIVLGMSILNMFIEMASGDDSKEHLKGILKSTLFVMTCTSIICCVFYFISQTIDKM